MASMASELKKKGIIPPMKRPMSTLGLARFIISTGNSAALKKATIRMREVRSADPMAKPLPMAAVVLPTASSESVILRTSGSISAISARPPALSATGP